jgi:protein-S-isoprenylcysteine O-methyltransferase Ste14
MAWTGWIAGALLLAGSLVGIAGAVCLRGNRTIFPEPRAGSSLIETGIYRHIRHPLYLSVILLSLAWGCWRHSLWCMLVCSVLAVFLVVKAASEERRLCRRFPGYPAYQQRTARFLPGVW